MFHLAGSCFRAAGGGCTDSRLDAIEKIVGANSLIGGLVNASPLVLVRGAQNLTKDGSNNATVQVDPTLGTLIELTVSTPLAIVYSGAGVLPYFKPGTYDGQLMRLSNKHTSSIGFNSGVGSSGVNISATITLGTHGSVDFQWRASSQLWEQAGAVFTVP